MTTLRESTEEVEAWLSRRLSSHYLVLYIDATYVNTRVQELVSRKALYTSKKLRVAQSGESKIIHTAKKRTSPKKAMSVNLIFRYSSLVDNVPTSVNALVVNKNTNVSTSGQANRRIRIAKSLHSAV